MSIAASPAGPLFQKPWYPIMRRFTVDEYHRMIDAGILTEDDGVELLEGWIVPKMARNPPHDGTLSISKRTLELSIPLGWHVRIQCAITTGDSEPEPDLAVVQGDERTYLQRHPAPADVGLLIEVANASLSDDRNDKARLYARAGIANYWIINLVDRCIEVYTDPTGPAAAPCFRQHQDYRIPQSILLVLAGKPIAPLAVSDLLP